MKTIPLLTRLLVCLGAAAGAGRTLDRVVRIEEDGAPEMPRLLPRMAADQQAATPIEPSTVEIHARVTLTAALQ